MLTTQEVRDRHTQGCPGSALSRSSTEREAAGQAFDEWLDAVIGAARDQAWDAAMGLRNEERRRA